MTNEEIYERARKAAIAAASKVLRTEAEPGDILGAKLANERAARYYGASATGAAP